MAKSRKLPWRTNPAKWTDTCVDEKLLKNPSLMTNKELAYALTEELEWRRGKGKYEWSTDPVLEGKEDEMPFSARVLGNIQAEVIARLEIIGDISMGRLKEKTTKKGK
jgi:hypothetical protein